MQYLEMSIGSKEKLVCASGLDRFCPDRLQVENQGFSEWLLQQQSAGLVAYPGAAVTSG